MGEMTYVMNNLDKFKENDIYGTPTIVNFDVVGDMSPGTFKYIADSLDIKHYLHNFNPKKIVEIGGGYGGMCKTLSVIYDFDEYILIDLPDVIDHCRKYLNNFSNLKNKITYITTEDLKSISEINNIDLSIAVSSLSECNRKTQDEYIEKIIKNSKYAYIVYNTCHIDVGKENYDKTFDTLSNYFYTSYLIDYADVQFMLLKNKRQGKNL